MVEYQQGLDPQLLCSPIRRHWDVQFGLRELGDLQVRSCDNRRQRGFSTWGPST